MLVIRDPEFGAGRLYDSRERRIVAVTDSWKEMVFDLVVEPTEQPCDDMISMTEVDSALNLMLCPGAIYRALALGNSREARLFNDMC